MREPAIIRKISDKYFLCVKNKGFKLYPETGKYLFDLCKEGKALVLSNNPTKDTVIEWVYDNISTFNGSQVRVCNNYPKYAGIDYGKYYIDLIQNGNRGK